MTDQLLPSQLPANYGTVLEGIKREVRESRHRAMLAVNAELVLLYWRVGSSISQAFQQEGWGAKVVDRLAQDIKASFPDMRGFSPRNLRYMRSFAEAYPDPVILQALPAKLPWTHNITLLERISASEERLWYAHKTIEHGWSYRILEIQIDTGLYQRQALSTKTTNFPATLPKALSDLAEQTLKDPYNLEFLGLAEDVEEKEFHRRLVQHMRRFLLELGVGFAFIGDHYRLRIGNSDFYPDLLFYHARLKCYVVIELKTTDFDPRDAGQLAFYVTALNETMKQSDDQPTIGLLLCRTKDKVVAEYSLKSSQTPMSISTFQLGQVLPTEQQLKAELASVEPPDEQ